MQIFARTNEQNEVMILGLSGEFDLSSVAEVRSHLHSVLADGWAHLVLDLDEVDFVDSAGLGVLVGLQRRCRAADGSLAIVLGSSDLQRLFEITRLDSILDIHPTIEGALSASKPDSETVDAP